MPHRGKSWYAAKHEQYFLTHHLLDICLTKRALHITVKVLHDLNIIHNHF